MRWRSLWSALALGAASVLASGSPSVAKDRSDDSTTAKASRSEESSSHAQDNQNASKEQANRDTKNEDDVDAQHHAALGVSLHDSDGRLHVIAVLPGSPAALAGIRIGDEITSADGQRVRTAEQLVEEIGEKRPGAQVELGIRRNGERQTVRAKLISLDTLHGRNTNADRNRSSNGMAENMNRSSRAGTYSNRGRSASYDGESTTSEDHDQMARRILALERQVSRLEAKLDGQRGNRSGRNSAFQGNGDNGWYYQDANPNDPNQGIHDYGARARDGQ